MANLLLNFTLKNVSPEYTYSDLKFPIEYDSRTSNIETNIDAAAIKRSVKNILDWKIGERILLPEFGNILYQYLYSKMNQVTVKNIEVGIRQMMRWEPRVAVTEINIVPYEEQNQYDVTVFYEIPRLKTRDSVQATLNVIT
jgi:phage baseplate assembly protein W